MTAALLALLLGALPARAATPAEDPTETLDRIHKLNMQRLGSYSAQRFLEHEALDQLPAAPQLVTASKTAKSAPEAVDGEPLKRVELPGAAANNVSAAAARAAQQIYEEAGGTLARPTPVKTAATTAPTATSVPSATVVTRTAPPAAQRPRRVTPENAATMDVSLDDVKEGGKEFDNNGRAGTGAAGAKKPERIYSNAKLPVE